MMGSLWSWFWGRGESAALTDVCVTKRHQAAFQDLAVFEFCASPGLRAF